MDSNTDAQAAAPPPPAPRRGVGRPALYANQAERQRAYRQRLKERGMRELKKIVRDVRPGLALKSEIIDLSEVRRW